MARGKHKKKMAQDHIRGTLLTLVGLALLIGLGAAAWWVQNHSPQIDSVTNCPAKGPLSVHLVIIDRSDPISGQQAQRVRQVLNALKSEALVGTRFDIYTFEGNSDDQLDPILKVCAPGKPEDAQALYENPEFVRRTYEQRFSAVLDGVVDQLLTASTRPNSPIIETLKAAAQTSFGDMPSGANARVTLISDMVQHSDAASQFRDLADFAQLSRSSTWPSLQPRLRGAQVDILYLIRPSALRGRIPIQNRGHQAFWEQLISASGGQLHSIEPI